MCARAIIIFYFSQQHAPPPPALINNVDKIQLRNEPGRSIEIIIFRLNRYLEITTFCRLRNGFGLMVTKIFHNRDYKRRISFILDKSIAGGLLKREQSGLTYYAVKCSSVIRRCISPLPTYLYYEIRTL